MFKQWLAVLAVSLSSLATAAQTGKIVATIDASKTGEPISPYIYGKFTEHIGDLMNRSVWAEMIDDRKFFRPVNYEAPKPPANAPARPGRAASRTWKSIGTASAVTMDTKSPYTGDQSPSVKLDASELRGIQQSGLVLRKGKAYTGRVVLSATPGARIRVSLVWGTGATERQTLAVPLVKSAFAKYPVKFVAGADTEDGRIEITGTGTGSFRIGAVSLMPANNVKGFRPEVLAQLKSLHSGMYRWGGNYISAHDWRDAIGDIDKRPPRWDNVWNAIQPNDIGNDEFLQLCEMVGVDPLLTVNAGFGEARSAADMVEYVNGSISTPMGKLRAANGHPAPYKVKWWMIGNEMWGEWQYGRMVDSQYAVKHNMFAKAMRKVDPGITLIANGNIPVRREDLGIANKDFNWTMLTKCLDNMDLMSEHWYVTAGQRPAPAQDKNVPAEETLVESVRQPADVTRGKFEAYDEYYKRLPDLKARKVGIIIDEWAFTGGRERGANLKQAIGNALVLQEMFRRTDLIKMGGHTSALSSIEYGPDGAALNAVGLTFKLYSDHFGTIPVQVGGNTPQPAPKHPGGGASSVTSGSPTYPLDISAALSADGKLLTVAVVNPTESAQQLELGFAGITPGAKGRMWTLAGPDVSAQTGLTRHEVTVTESVLNGVAQALSVAPLSINVYEFPRQ